VSGFEVSEASARILENAAAGPILVVRGRLRNPGPSPRALGAPLEVQLLDADGSPLAGQTALAGAPLPDLRLREASPEEMLGAQQAAAPSFLGAPVAAGSELSFSAIFAPLPREARRFALSAGAR
jgi:hypothetical protein